MTEIWRDVPRFEGVYSVSNLGKVRSNRRIYKGPDGSMRRVPNRIMTPRAAGKRCVVVLTHQVNFAIRKEIFRLERLVWEAFKGPVPIGFTVVRKVRDLRNNQLSNLMLAEIEVPVK